MDIHDYLGVLRRGWALLVIGVLVGIAGGAFAQSVQLPSYSATSRDLITNDTTTDLSDSLQASSLAQSRIASYVQVVTSGLVLQPVIDQLGLHTSVEELASRMSVSSPPNTLVIEITATAATASLAQRIANAASRVFSAAVADQIEAGVLSTPSPTPSPAPGAKPAPATVISPVKVVNIEQAALPPAPNVSYGPLFPVVGGLVGLAAGLVLASVRESIDRRIRSRRDVAAVTSLPVLGQLRPDGAIRRTPLVVTAAASGSTAESFRAIRANLEHIRLRDGRGTFVIAAMGPGQGSTTITANLALAIANTATSVVVVDASLLSGGLSLLFDSHGARGLSDILVGESDLDSVLRHGSAAGPWLLPAGSTRPENGELLATRAMRELLAELQHRFDVVLIDAPAVGPVPDAAVLGSFGGSTLLVVAAGAATRPALADALATLAAGGSTPVGIVLNRIPRLRRGRRAKSRERLAPAAKVARAARQKVARAKAVGLAATPAPALAAAAQAPPSRFAPDPGVYAARTTVEPARPLIAAGPPVAGPLVPPAASPVAQAAVPVEQPAVPTETAEAIRQPRRVTVGGYSNVTAITPAISKERIARENYLLKSRELEQAALDRLAHEQRRLELRIRDQLDHDRRELGLVLDDQLEDTVIMPKAADGLA